MSERYKWPPRGHPMRSAIQVLCDGPDIVHDAHKLAVLGAQHLRVGDFVEAARLLKAAGSLANRAEFLRERIARRGAKR